MKTTMSLLIASFVTFTFLALPHMASAQKSEILSTHHDVQSQAFHDAAQTDPSLQKKLEQAFQTWAQEAQQSPLAPKAMRLEQGVTSNEFHHDPWGTLPSKPGQENFTLFTF